MPPVRRRRLLLAGLGGTLVVGLLGVLAALLASCSSSPAPVAVHTFERAQRVDIVCLQVLDTTTFAPITPTPVTPSHCGPTPTDIDPATEPYHLYALVTQTLRGELAVVDLTAGQEVDVNAALPGTSFLPVGANPTDVAATPDGAMVFVASAEANKPAIYGIPGASILGDATAVNGGVVTGAPPVLASWPACALPQAPGRIAIVPTTAAPGDAGADAGASAAGYEVVVVLPGSATQSAKVVTLDTARFIDQSRPDHIAPGSLAPCPISGAVALSDKVPGSWQPGPAWPDGVPYADGGVDLFQPLDSGLPQLPTWACTSTADAGAASDAGIALRPLPGSTPRGAGIVTDGKYVYVADNGLPIIHVFDAGQPGSLQELAPLLVTSRNRPQSIVTAGELALSPPTHDYKRYLYALDKENGSLIVYDVTDPVAGPHTPLERPNAELDPFKDPDRINFGVPITTVSFARHDFPLSTDVIATPGGLLCNPNPNVGTGAGTFTDNSADPVHRDQVLGANYRANVTQSVDLGPARLRGVFAFATLSNGTVAVIDVDDWDAPCRRPATLSASSPPPGALALPQASSGPADLDPYHTPVAASGVDGGAEEQYSTQEVSFPVVVPNEPRSLNALVDDPTLGSHWPQVVGTPLLYQNDAPVPSNSKFARIMAPYLRGAAASEPALSAASPPNILFSFDRLQAQLDQDWTVTYEGALPGFDGVAANLSTDDSFASIRLDSTDARFCRAGVEDHRLGQARVADMVAEDSGAHVGSQLAERIGDYVQLTDDILPDTDPYWQVDNDCWDVDVQVGQNSTVNLQSAKDQRQPVCQNKFGDAATQLGQRDFPILEAYEDHVVVGRYLYNDAANRPTNGRIIAPRDTSSQVDFKLLKCCFHNQARFRVRTGGEWVAVGSQSGYMHHVQADPKTRACVWSCDPNEVLLNSRAPEWVAAASDTSAPDRSSAYAARNPMFAFYMRAPPLANADKGSIFTYTTRDALWKWTTTGGYQPFTVSLTTDTNAVTPQSMRYIAPLGQMAVVDGASQGLMLLDLNSLALSATYY